MISSTTNKVVQLFLTLFLTIILFGIISLYIYWGMKQANKTIDVVEQPKDQLEKDSGSTTDRRAKMLEQLSLESNSTTSIEERAVILNKLEASIDSDSTTTSQKRRDILDGLAN